MISEVLKRFREEKKITQSEFATSIGVSRPYITQIESGKKTPSLAVLIEIAQKMNITLDELVGRQDKAA